MSVALSSRHTMLNFIFYVFFSKAEKHVHMHNTRWISGLCRYVPLYTFYDMPYDPRTRRYHNIIPSRAILNIIPAFLLLLTLLLRQSRMTFDSLVEVICFFSISTLVKLTETCRKFVNGVKYHQSFRNPHQMRSLWIDKDEQDIINVEYCGHNYTPISNANHINQLLSDSSPNFLTGLSQKIYVDVGPMSLEYFQVNFECNKLKEVKRECLI